MARELAQHGQRGAILDGYPRTLAQAHALSEIADVQQVLNLRMPDEVRCRTLLAPIAVLQHDIGLPARRCSPPGLSIASQGVQLHAWLGALGMLVAVSNARSRHGCLTRRLPEQALVEKSLARRACSRCGSVFSMRSVSLPATAESESLHLPAILPSPGCLPHLTTRADDTPAAVLRRLEVRMMSCNSAMRCHTMATSVAH